MSSFVFRQTKILSLVFSFTSRMPNDIHSINIFDLSLKIGILSGGANLILLLACNFKCFQRNKRKERNTLWGVKRHNRNYLK